MSTDHDAMYKAIDAIEAKIGEHKQVFEKETEPHRLAFEKAVQPLRATVNSILSVIGEPPRYQEEGEVIDPSGGTGGSKIAPAIKPDEYFNKPLATAVRMALIYLRSRNQAPASIEAIHDLLITGGFAFPTKSKEAAIQSLSISIGKNSEVFAKVGNGLIGLREWYGAPSTRRARTRANGADASSGGADLDPAQDVEQEQPAEGQQEGTT